LGIDVDALLDAAVEQGGHVRHDAGEWIQLVAYHIFVPKSCNSAYGETDYLEWGETADRQLDDASADLQAAHRRQVAADGEVCDQEDGALFCTKEEPSPARIWAYVHVESAQDNRQAAGLDIEYI